MALKGTVIENTLTKERRLFFDTVEAREYISTLNSNFRILSFHQMNADERLDVLKYHLKELENYDNELRGTGRTYQNSIQLSARDLSLIIEDIEKVNK